jgi:hypothetical protein
MPNGLTTAAEGIGRGARKILRGSSNLLDGAAAYLKAAGKSESEINAALESLTKALSVGSKDVGKELDSIFAAGKGAELTDDLIKTSRALQSKISSLKTGNTQRIRSGAKGSGTQDGAGMTEATVAGKTSARKAIGDAIWNNPKTTLALLSVTGLTAYAVAAFTATDGKRFDITSIEKDSNGRLVVKFRPAPWPGAGPTVGWNITNTDTIDFDTSCYFVNSANNPTHEIRDVKLGDPNSLTIDDDMSYSSTSASSNLGFFTVNTSFTGQFVHGVDGALNVIYEILQKAADIPVGVFCDTLPFLCGLDTTLIIVIIVIIVVLCCSSSVAVVMMSSSKPK